MIRTRNHALFYKIKDNVFSVINNKKKKEKTNEKVEDFMSLLSILSHKIKESAW